jgi:hypothetical protein
MKILVIRQENYLKFSQGLRGLERLVQTVLSKYKLLSDVQQCDVKMHCKKRTIRLRLNKLDAIMYTCMRKWATIAIK